MSGVPVSLDFADGYNRAMQQWQEVAHRSSRSHYEAMRFFANRHLWLGLAAVITGAVAGGSVIKSLSTSEPIANWLFLAAGILAPVFATLQTFLKDGERSEKHRLTGAAYGGALRLATQWIEVPAQTREKAQETLSLVRTTLDELGKAAPALPGRFVPKFGTPTENLLEQRT